MPQIDICQQWAVSVSASALENAGYLGDVLEQLGVKQGNFANALGGEIETYQIKEFGLIELYVLPKNQGYKMKKHFLMR